jgi:hypothetical protein
MFAPSGIGGLIQAPNGTYTVASDGTITANSADVQYLVSLGFEFAVIDHRFFVFPGAPAIKNATVTVSSVALTSGTLTIAAQPDVPRQLAVVLDPSGTISAGTLTMVYTANDGTSQTDVLSLVATGLTTLTTTKGVERLTSATVAGVSGGSTPGIQVGTNNFLAVPVPPRFVDWALTSEKKITPTAGTLGLSVPADEAIATLVVSSGALFSPTQVPDGTHGMSVGYTYTYPG